MVQKWAHALLSASALPAPVCANTPPTVAASSALNACRRETGLLMILVSSSNFESSTLASLLSLTVHSLAYDAWDRFRGKERRSPPMALSGWWTATFGADPESGVLSPIALEQNSISSRYGRVRERRNTNLQDVSGRRVTLQRRGTGHRVARSRTPMPRASSRPEALG